MSNEEELDHKRVQAVYLRKLLECLNEDIAELELEICELGTSVDPYAKLKAAHAAGKRIAHKHKRRHEKYFEICNYPAWSEYYDYKIVKDDETFEVNSVIFGKYRTVIYTKCALTGKITAGVQS